MKTRTYYPLLTLVAGIVLIGGGFAACQTAGPTTYTDAAQQVYVAPGEHDEFYAFMSGGFSGQLTVHGLPSGRLLKTVPVFSQHAENGWGYNEETKPMMMTSYGFVPWDDAHHPELSMTAGVPDGRCPSVPRVKGFIPEAHPIRGHGTPEAPCLEAPLRGPVERPR